VTTTETSPHPMSRGALPAAVLFDMDGLLIDTEPLWFQVEGELLAELGARWSKTDHALLVGSSAAVASAFISEKSGGRATPQQVAAEMLARMAQRLRHPPPLQPGALRLINQLDDAGVPRALVSSSARVLIDAALDGLALSFDVVVAGDAVRHNKPHPEPYLTAAKLIGADPIDWVALEDSPPGAASATAAGCVVIAVPSVTAIDPAERRVVVPSLDQVDLPYVRSLFG
jgi:HAD superfamily hydrolase (TIGR01509 family)